MMPWLKCNDGSRILIEGNPEAELRAQLLKLTDKLGHQVSQEEYLKELKLPEPDSFAYYFGSFSKVAEDAWGEVRKGRTMKEEPKNQTNEIEEAETIETLQMKILQKEETPEGSSSYSLGTKIELKITLPERDAICVSFTL